MGKSWVNFVSALVAFRPEARKTIKYFLLKPPAQDTHAYNKIGRIIAVYIHFIVYVFIPHVLPTICLHCINAVVALQVIRVIRGFPVSLLSKLTSNSIAS